MSTKVIVALYEAVGGPKHKKREADGLMAGPTDKGEYVFAYCGKASSPKYYRFWSKVRWGTSLREKNGVLQVYVRRRWRPLKNFTPATKKDILDYHEELYGTRRLPEKWVFNDFGHLACRYFKDLDKDGRRDKNERLHSELLHTTPVDEADSAQGRPVYLSESHGCIHVKPKDIDEMKQNGFLKSGNKLFVHKYTETAPRVPRGSGGPPFEVHFFPGSMMIVVKGHRPRAGSGK
jgi:hypothetical protein